MTEAVVLAVVAGILLRLLVAMARPLLTPVGSKMALLLLKWLVRLDSRREDILAEVAWIQVEEDRSGLPEAAWAFVLIGGRMLVAHTATRIRAILKDWVHRLGRIHDRLSGLRHKRGTASRAYAHTNSKGVTYMLHSKIVVPRGGRARRIFYFAKDLREAESIGHLPAGCTVVENPRSGFLLLKKLSSVSIPVHD